MLRRRKATILLHHPSCNFCFKQHLMSTFFLFLLFLFFSLTAVLPHSLMSLILQKLMQYLGLQIFIPIALVLVLVVIQRQTSPKTSRFQLAPENLFYHWLQDYFELMSQWCHQDFVLSNFPFCIQCVKTILRKQMDHASHSRSHMHAPACPK